MNVTDLKGQTIAFLASGGLDSCTVTHWLSSKGVQVVTFTADLGQPDEENLDHVAERMRACGAYEAVIVPLVEEMAEAGIEAMQAQATYEGDYWITTPHGRYVTMRGILPHVIGRGISVLSHGATGRGNDQVRFQLLANMLAPGLHVYAPWRDQEFIDAFGGRQEMIEYCESNGLPIKHSKAKPYSTDANIMGLSHEAGELESLSTSANFVEPEMGVRATDAPDAVETVTIAFAKGRPTAINGEQVLSAADALGRANEIAGRHGVGINQHLLENRFVGTKSRGVYEAPGMELLGAAYAFILQAVLDRRARRIFDFASVTLSEQYYQGYGEDLASKMLKSAVADVAELVTGTVTVDLYKGNVQFVSMDAVPHSIYIEKHASMDDVEGYDHADSEGFLRVLGLSATAIGRSGHVSSLHIA